MEKENFTDLIEFLLAIKNFRNDELAEVRHGSGMKFFTSYLIWLETQTGKDRIFEIKISDMKKSIKNYPDDLKEIINSLFGDFTEKYLNGNQKVIYSYFSGELKFTPVGIFIDNYLERINKLRLMM